MKIPVHIEYGIFEAEEIEELIISQIKEQKIKCLENGITKERIQEYKEEMLSIYRKLEKNEYPITLKSAKTHVLGSLARVMIEVIEFMEEKLKEVQ